jgi:hypothetical protein
MSWQPQVFSAEFVHRDGQRCVKQYLYLMPQWPLEPAADSLPHTIHGGHGSVMQSLLPHVIAVTGVSCTSCTYVMAVTSV